MKSASCWRTPLVVLLFGSVILTLSLGIRHGFGLFLRPMSLELGWGREAFAFAIALQNLVWGAAQPVTGMLADRFGAGSVLLAGALLYAGGLVLMAYSSTPLELSLSAGILIGLALSGTSFSVVYGVLGRVYPPEKRSLALGIGGAAGSFGQFAMLPVSQTLISAWGWQEALLCLALGAAVIAPLAIGMVEPAKPTVGDEARPSAWQSLREACADTHFRLLSFGFFVCGFQVVFVAIHLPAYLLDRGLPPQAGVTALALIGLFNIFGTYLAGYYGARFSKPRLLSLIYALRALVIVGFLPLSATSFGAYAFAAAMGFLWLGTVPLTNGIVASRFGVAYLSMLSGVVFLSHQLGAFLGGWLGGYLFDRTGSYDVVWFVAIGLSVAAALLNWPIQERPIAARLAEART